MLDHVRGGHERHRARNDFIARLNAQTIQRKVQRRGGRVGSDRTTGAQEFREAALEEVGLRPGAYQAGSQRVHDFSDLLLANVRGAEDDGLRPSVHDAQGGGAP